MVNLEVLNPVAEIVRKEDISLAPRLSDLNGKTIGFYWNAKPGGDTINKTTADLLTQKFQGISVKNYFGSMGGVMRQASPEDVTLMAKECDAIVGSLAD